MTTSPPMGAPAPSRSESCGGPRYVRSLTGSAAPRLCGFLPMCPCPLAAMLRGRLGTKVLGAQRDPCRADPALTEYLSGGTADRGRKDCDAARQALLHGLLEN